MMGRTTTRVLLLTIVSLSLNCSQSSKTPAADKPAKGEVLKVTDANFESVVLQSKVPVLVDFWAIWCGPCKQQAPIIEELAGQFAGRAVLAKLDFDANKRSPAKYKITGLPTLLIFKDGKVAKKLVGLTSKNEVAAALEATLR